MFPANTTFSRARNRSKETPFFEQIPGMLDYSWFLLHILPARSNPPLIAIVPTDKEPHDLSIILHTQRPVIPIHPCRPVWPHPLEMQRGMPMIVQPKSELLPSNPLYFRPKCRKLLTKRRAGR